VSLDSGSGIVNSKALSRGKIMTNEEDESVVVNSRSYWKLFKPAGGCCPLFFINLSMMAFVLASIASNYFL